MISLSVAPPRPQSYLRSYGFGVCGPGVALPLFFPKLNLIFKLGFFCPSETTRVSPLGVALFSDPIFGVLTSFVLLGNGVLPLPLGSGTRIFVLEELDVCEPGVESRGRGEPLPYDGSRARWKAGTGDGPRKEDEAAGLEAPGRGWRAGAGPDLPRGQRLSLSVGT